MGLNIPSGVTVRPTHGDEDRPNTLQLPPCALHGSNVAMEALSARSVSAKQVSVDTLRVSADLMTFDWVPMGLYVISAARWLKPGLIVLRLRT